MASAPFWSELTVISFLPLFTSADATEGAEREEEEASSLPPRWWSWKRIKEVAIKKPHLLSIMREAKNRGSMFNLVYVIINLVD